MAKVRSQNDLRHFPPPRPISKYAIIGAMNTKILDQLEFNKVKDQFTEYLQTEQAQAELRDLVPMTNPERIQNQFTEIQEMAEIFVEHHGFAIGSLRDISEPLRRLELDADLNIQELIAIKKVLQASADLGRFYADLENVELVALKRLSKRLKPSQVYKAVFKASMTVVSLSILLAQSCKISVVNLNLVMMPFARPCKTFSRNLPHVG